MQNEGARVFSLETVRLRLYSPQSWPEISTLGPLLLACFQLPSKVGKLGNKSGFRGRVNQIHFDHVALKILPDSSVEHKS